MLHLCHRHFRDPLSRRPTATLLAYLRQILRRDTELLRVPLYLTLVGILLQQLHELMEGIVAMVGSDTSVLLGINERHLIHIIEHLHRSRMRQLPKNLQTEFRLLVLQLQR